MIIKYLGTAAAEGRPALFCQCERCKKARELGGKEIRTRSQSIIDNKLLIDFPADTYYHYFKFNFSLPNIENCLITHSHSDHPYLNEIAMRKKDFSNIKEGGKPLTFYADENTVFVLNHFSHNGKNNLYCELSEIAKKDNLFVAYDGMEIEF